MEKARQTFAVYSNKGKIELHCLIAVLYIICTLYKNIHAK